MMEMLFVVLLVFWLACGYSSWRWILWNGLNLTPKEAKAKWYLYMLLVHLCYGPIGWGIAIIAVYLIKHDK